MTTHKGRKRPEPAREEEHLDVFAKEDGYGTEGDEDHDKGDNLLVVDGFRVRDGQASVLRDEFGERFRGWTTVE